MLDAYRYLYRYIKKMSTYLSSPVPSPCRAECHWTGINSTRPMRFWSTYVLKWELSREREIDLKSSTEKKKPMLLIKNCSHQIKTKFKRNIINNLVLFSPHSIIFLNLTSQKSPMPWTTNIRWSTCMGSPGNKEKITYMCISFHEHHYAIYMDLWKSHCKL